MSILKKLRDLMAAKDYDVVSEVSEPTNNGSVLDTAFSKGKAKRQQLEVSLQKLRAEAKLQEAAKAAIGVKSKQLQDLSVAITTLKKDVAVGIAHIERNSEKLTQWKSELDERAEKFLLTLEDEHVGLPISQAPMSQDPWSDLPTPQAAPQAAAVPATAGAAEKEVKAAKAAPRRQAAPKAAPKEAPKVRTEEAINFEDS